MSGLFSDPVLITSFMIFFHGKYLFLNPYQYLPLFLIRNSRHRSPVFGRIKLNHYTVNWLIIWIYNKYCRVSMVLSMNLSLAASVCLISRVQSNDTAFSLLILSMLLFSYWPQLRNDLILHCPILPLYLVCFTSPFLAYLLHSFSTAICSLYIFVNIFMLLFCPWVLIRMQPLKRLLFWWLI